MNKYIKNILYLLIAISIGVGVSYAGSLTPPGSVADTMYSLTDIWTLATTGETADIGEGSIETTPSTIEETGKTLTEVYEAVALALAPPTFAQTDQTTYTCESLATDPDQPLLDLETICGYHTGDGCSWSGGACIGGVQTPADGYMTWYAGTASCSEKLNEGSTSWRLPTYLELVKHYLDNNIEGAPPEYFLSDGYWSSTTYPNGSDVAYNVNMYGGNAGYDNKNSPYYLVHCTH
jgi:hypothetical protein